ncbi:uncharacterized protein [Leptinotarsa decemlineata]|uniref:uncharacterized protein n=1 Tax=Leptinotarsa decemlineata TaxID=7539 RepID=UPI003D304153
MAENDDPIEPYKLAEIFSIVPEYDGDSISLGNFINACDHAERMAVNQQKTSLTIHIRNKLRGKAAQLITSRNPGTYQEIRDELPNIIIEGDDNIGGEIDIFDVVQEDGGAIAAADNLQDIDGVIDPELEDEGIDDDPATDNGNIIIGSRWMNISETVENNLDLYCVTDSHILFPSK